MPDTSLTPSDLLTFKKELLSDITLLFEKYLNMPKNEMIRSSTVKQMLNISDSKLERLRNSGLLPSVKILGSLYFKKADVEKLFSKPNSSILECH
jgi:hypothetical protein